jgi:hypothetical protein
MPDEVLDPLPVTIEDSNVTRLYDWFKLLDPNQEGVGLDKVRGVFPSDGWHVVLAHINVLLADGRVVKSPVIGQKGVLLFEKYTWKAV